MRTNAIAPSPGGVEIAATVSEMVISSNPNCRATASVAKYLAWAWQRRYAAPCGHRNAASLPVAAEHFAHCGDQLFVFFHCAYGNAHPFRQTIAFERAHDDFPLQQFLEHCTTIADVYHEEICSGRHERNLYFGKLFLQISATFVYH